MKRYALKVGTRVYKDQSGDIRTFSPALGEIKTFGGFEGDRALMRTLETPRTPDEIRRSLSSSDIAVSEEELVRTLAAFSRYGVTQTEEGAERAASGLEAFLAELDPSAAEAAQPKLGRSVAVVVGLGTVGSAVSVMLSQVGVGTLVLVDEDTVEAKNLANQVAYGRGDVGRRKAMVLYDFIGDRARTRLGVEDRKVRSSGDVAEILERWVVPASPGPAIVINCADEPAVDAIAAWISGSLCELGLSIPYIAGGGYAGHLGSIGPTIIPGETACWSCYEEQVRRVRADTVDSWQEIARRTDERAARPVFAPLGMFVASLIASEAVWVLTRLNRPLLAGRHAEWDVRKGGFSWNPIRPRPGCECGAAVDFPHESVADQII